MWGRAMGGTPRLLPPLLLLLLLPGAVGLECLSCGAEDGKCPEAKNITCPPESDVCTEALVGVTWSHGAWALGGRGCARGGAGSHARALELGGVVAFARRSQCRGGRGCNSRLPLGSPGALPLPGNASGQAPNGVRCYGCPDDGPCPPLSVVQCYGDLRACFHGNVTLALGGGTVWREVWGCARAGGCGGWAQRGDGAVGLSGSCCTGDLCNGPPPANRTFFAPDLPRLELLPHGHAPTATPPPAKMADGTTAGGESLDATAKMADGEAERQSTRANVAAGRQVADGVTGGPKMAAADPKMTTVDPKMAAVDPRVASGDKMAAADPNMAAADPNMAAADPNKMAAGDKMAAGRAGRPLERKDGTKGPVGRGQPTARPAWLLPFLLLPLL